MGGRGILQQTRLQPWLGTSLRVCKLQACSYVVKTVILGTWVRYCSREDDSGEAHGVVSLGTEAA